MPHAPILLTRPKAQADAFARRIEDVMGPGEIVISPLLEIVPKGTPPDLDRFDAIVLTSANAVTTWSIKANEGMVAYCVGDATARAAKAAGFAVKSASGDWRALAKVLSAERPFGRLLYLRGEHTVGDLKHTLSVCGLDVSEQIVYAQNARDLTPEAAKVLAKPHPVLIPVFSPRSAKLLGPHLNAAAAETHIAAISPAVRDALPVQTVSRLEVATHPTAESVLERLAALQYGLRA
ncbi:MAG: uroporphyrinogen-III synthase [Pseudomonadota bacterium]